MFEPKNQTFLLIDPVSSVGQTQHATVKSDMRGGKITFLIAAKWDDDEQRETSTPLKLEQYSELDDNTDSNDTQIRRGFREIAIPRFSTSTVLYSEQEKTEYFR